MVVRAQVSKSPNTEMRELFAAGFGIHHAGMLRQDRLLMEKLFARGLVKVGLEQFGAV
jgi:replicative superfamily II helicase